MELNDIMQLVKAGFSKNEIMQMAPNEFNIIESEPAPVTTVSPFIENRKEQLVKPEPVAEPAPVEKAEPVPAPAQEPAEPTMAELMDSIVKLTSAVQSNAIAHSVIPSSAINPAKAEDLLAEIIRPTYKERG